GEPRMQFELGLDPGWLRTGDFHGPFELRHVRVQDTDSWTVLAQGHFALDLPTAPRSTGAAPSIAGLTARQITLGPTTSTPVGLPQDMGTQPLFGLMLVHGWCSSGGVWPTSQFTHPLLVFHDPDANRSHDEFAQRLATLGAQNRSFGVIGHSQGGPAAVHLRTYYVSGLDRATGGRPIQSLASPYQGTPLAGLGFFLCGNNTDLGTSGSAAWLANIPSWVRDEVYYYTTSNSGSACNFATNLFLSNPEDGTVEQFRGQLPGAHNMGHVTGWCHTTGMSNPAGYTDAARNAIMNQNAAH
ncbi:MAG: conditioned medium factor, partial [Planctomycetes bacterium]|nr:conditioned medium factor [Planctomycetota bacterium]